MGILIDKKKGDSLPTEMVDIFLALHPKCEYPK